MMTNFRQGKVSEFLSGDSKTNNISAYGQDIEHPHTIKNKNYVKLMSSFMTSA